MQHFISNKNVYCSFQMLYLIIRFISKAEQASVKSVFS